MASMESSAKLLLRSSLMVLRRIDCRAFSDRGRPGGRLPLSATFCREAGMRSSCQLSVVSYQLSPPATVLTTVVVQFGTFRVKEPGFSPAKSGAIDGGFSRGNRG